MKIEQIKTIVKKGSLSPFMVAKLIFNDSWRTSHLQNPILSEIEKQSLVNNLSGYEYQKYREWNDWFNDLNDITKAAQDCFLESETKLFQFLWLLEGDVTKIRIRNYFKNLNPTPTQLDNLLIDKTIIVWPLKEFDYTLLSRYLKSISERFQQFQFYKMLIDILSDKLAIPLNNDWIELGIESLKVQTERLGIFRDLLFLNLFRITSVNEDLEEKFSPLLLEYQEKTVEEYYPSETVVEFCKSKIASIISEDFPDIDWFYEVKDFFMKEDIIKKMSSEEIESYKSMGNKEQVKHFMGLVKQSKPA
jgi:hypothetical protein